MGPLVQGRLLAFPVLHHQPLDDYISAARFYRQTRKTGVTIRNTLDCLIAATCVRAGATLLHSDRDFDRLARCTPLKVFA